MGEGSCVDYIFLLDHLSSYLLYEGVARKDKYNKHNYHEHEWAMEIALWLLLHLFPYNDNELYYSKVVITAAAKGMKLWNIEPFLHYKQPCSRDRHWS